MRLSNWIALCFSCLAVLCFVFFITEERENNQNLNIQNNLLVLQISELNSSLGDYEIKISQKDNKIAEFNLLYENQTNLVEEQSAEIEQLNQTLTENSAEIQTLKNDKQVLGTEKANLQTRIEELQASEEANQEEISNLQLQLEEKNAEIQAKDNRISELETENLNLQTQLEEKTTQLETLQTEKTNLKNQVNTLTAEKQALINERDQLQAKYDNVLLQLSEYKQYAVIVEDISIIAGIKVSDSKTITDYSLGDINLISTILFYSWQNLDISFVEGSTVLVDGMEVDSALIYSILGSERIGSTITIKNGANIGPLDFSEAIVTAVFDGSKAFTDELTITNNFGQISIVDNYSGQQAIVKNVDYTNGIIEYQIDKTVSGQTVAVTCTLDFINLTTSATAKVLFTTVNWSGTMTINSKTY